jgi:hypothetical protein
MNKRGPVNNGISKIIAKNSPAKQTYKATISMEPEGGAVSNEKKEAKSETINEQKSGLPGLLTGGIGALIGRRAGRGSVRAASAMASTPMMKADPRRTIGRGKNFNKANPTGTGAKAGGGMTQKGVNEYKRNNPGSKLQTAVTKKPSELKPGSKDAKRRKSFCARSKSWTSERGRAARRRWNC